MHEIGVAQNILDIVLNQANIHKAEKVNSIKLVIGEFTGIVQESLEFALETLKKETLADKAEIIFSKVKLKTFCSKCDKTFIMNGKFLFQCPHCEGNLEIINGKELYIENIDIE
jgi:hydrogenase nickel incorporation protein HypA/HybF